jgi:hypothetical protein
MKRAVQVQVQVSNSRNTKINKNSSIVQRAPAQQNK